MPSYQKDRFSKMIKPMSLGTIALAVGRAELKLRATAISATEVAEIRYVALTRK